MDKKFESFNEAFDFCREKNCPVIVRIQNERWKLYPSGKAKKQKSLPPSGRLGKLIFLDERELPSLLSDLNNNVKRRR